ncbi:PKD domain-containing protein [Xylanibacter caecicola]|uniref:PKD domain-containing protein n=1 Tax=Xylanibacter caecicola TaxID=2736294 RepID=UPI0025887CF0|nr:PKD domain-containing protein [Xylanibacter caecicola]
MTTKRKIMLSAFTCMALGMYSQSQDVTVLQLHPAPGQFVNTLPEANSESTHEEMCAKATESLRNGELIHLGTYGGYVTVQFDHPVKNLRGSDLRITGNGFYANADPVYGQETIGGSFEPGIVYVGVGNDVETAQWYELAGSEYYTTEIHDFSITYHKPTAEEGEHKQFCSVYDNYIKWEATWTENGERRDSTGYHIKNSFHKQTYWPLWEKGETLTFSGGKLPNNAIDQSGKGTYWVLYRYAPDAYGYVDASLNTDDYSTFDIDWAVDKDGNHVDLEEINFVKVVCGIFQYCGWLGETSTEVAGFQDLHLIEGYDDNPIIITPRQPAGINNPTASSAKDGYIYDLTGRRVTSPTRGIYIKNGRKIYIK